MSDNLPGIHRFKGKDQKWTDKKNRGFTDIAEVLNCRNMYLQGKSISECAKHFGVSKTCVQKLLAGKSYDGLGHIPSELKYR